ncbi:MAG TPA: oligosaccharide flippase family protein [Solirubrobacteraceae bacterium]|nr:oligosaccharide flippase family protein [Solirubrobacteraceae bacterium]
MAVASDGGDDDLKARAATAVGVLGRRAVVVLAVGIVANTLLARLLTPADFGLVALGGALVTAGSFLAIGGLAPQLIVRDRAPDAQELSSVLGLVLAVTLAISGVTAGVAVQFGRDGTIVALMVACLPLLALRAPASIVLERELSYRSVARAELAESLAFYAWAVGTVAAGWGVWGLASGAIVRAALGSALMIRLAPGALPRPSLSWRRVRPLVGYGLAFQGTRVVMFVREQGLNVGVAAIAGLSVLGVWSLAFRVLQISYLMFKVLWRVSYPAMGRLLASGADPRPAVEGGARVVVVATGALLCPLAGSAHALLPPLVGPGWDGLADVVLVAALGIAAAAPQSVAVTGFLLASGAARTILLSSVAQAAVWLAVAFALLPSLGVIAVGLGWLASSATGVLTLGLPARRRSGARLWTQLAAPVAFTLLGCGTGYLVGTLGDPSVPLGLAAAAASLAVFAAGVLAAARPAVRQTLAVARVATGRGTGPGAVSAGGAVG